MYNTKQTLVQICKNILGNGPNAVEYCVEDKAGSEVKALIYHHTIQYGGRPYSTDRFASH